MSARWPRRYSRLGGTKVSGIKRGERHARRKRAAQSRATAKSPMSEGRGGGVEIGHLRQLFPDFVRTVSFSVSFEVFSRIPPPSISQQHTQITLYG